MTVCLKAGIRKILVLVIRSLYCVLHFISNLFYCLNRFFVSCFNLMKCGLMYYALYFSLLCFVDIFTTFFVEFLLLLLLNIVFVDAFGNNHIKALLNLSK